METNKQNEPKRQGLAEIVRRLQAGTIKMSDLSNETLQALAGTGLEQYTEEQLHEIVRTGKLPGLSFAS